MRLNITSGNPFEYFYGFSRAVRVGDTVVVSGTLARDPDVDGIGAYQQARSALTTIERALAEAGASLRDVIRTTTYIVDPSDIEEVARAHMDVFTDIAPATTLVVVKQLIQPRYKVEIQVDAVVGSGEMASETRALGASHEHGTHDPA